MKKFFPMLTLTTRMIIYQSYRRELLMPKDRFFRVILALLISLPIRLIIGGILSTTTPYSILSIIYLQETRYIFFLRTAVMNMLFPNRLSAIRRMFPI